MPKGFIAITDVVNQRPIRLAVAHIVSVAAGRSGGAVITMVSKDEDQNDQFVVDETPDEIDALIEGAQGEAPRSEFAQAMGGAVAAFGGGRR